MDIVELDMGDARTVGKFQAFYDGVFSKCFPRDEIGSVQAYLDIKEGERLSGGAYEYHLTFMEDAERYLACFIYCWFPKIRMIAAEFACVEEGSRGRNFSKALMKRAEEKHDFKWMFAEVENANAANRVIWSKYGFKAIPVKYRQLSLGEGRMPVDGMELCAYGRAGERYIPLADVRDFVWHYYRYSQFCPDPDGTDFIRAMDERPDKGGSLRLLPLWERNG